MSVNQKENNQKNPFRHKAQRTKIVRMIFQANDITPYSLQKDKDNSKENGFAINAMHSLNNPLPSCNSGY